VTAGVIQWRKKAAMGGIVVAAALIALTWLMLRRPPTASPELTQKPPAELKQQRLTFSSGENPVRFAAISPDTKYLAYSDRTGIHVKLLSTGEERLIPRPAGVPASAYWDLDSWFPDGTQLLADAIEPGDKKSMWTVSMLGQSPRQLREGASGYGVSPDGTHIAFSPYHGIHRRLEDGAIPQTEYIREIWVMGIQGDNPQKVFAVGENESLPLVRWSPDGQRLAYIRVQRARDKFQCSIETCDLKGASRTVVLSADLMVNDFYWLPEGRVVYVRRESGAATGILESNSNDDNFWQIGIDNRAGTSTGKPKRITQWAGSSLRGLSASADGKRLALHKSTFQRQVYVGELADGGARMKTPWRLTNDEGSDDPTAWMPDSKAVLFLSNRSGTWGLFKQGISQATSEPVFTAPQDVSYPRLSADGAWILFLESPRNPADATSPQRLMRVAVNGGAPQFVMETRNLDDFGCARALCVIRETSPDLKQLVITAFDPLKGRGKVLRTIEQDPSHTYDHTSPSPDGSTLAISRSGEAEIHVRFLSLSGGSDREITVKGWPSLTGLDWSPDGRRLYCGSRSPQGSTLLSVDLNGNARVLWQYQAGSGAIWGVPSPDGRYLAILGDVINSNVWMVQGF
jgi:Tol biopolymer transport system component